MWVVFKGDATLRDLGKAFEAFRKHPDYHTELDELLDWSRASMRRLAPADTDRIRSFLSQQEDRFDTKQAVLVSADLDFGLYRMFDMRADGEVPQDRHVFRNVEEALEWLRPGCATEMLAQFHERMDDRN